MIKSLEECFNPDMYSNAQIDPAQLSGEYCDLSRYCQPAQADHAQYHTPSETMSSPDGSVGLLTPSPKKKAKSLPKQRQSNLRNQYMPTPTTETHNTVETPDDINDNSACDMSAEAMSMTCNDLQSIDSHANSGVNFAQSNAASFTNNNDHSNVGLHYAQNLGYQNGQLPYNPHAAVHPPNQPFNTSYMKGPTPSNFGSTESIAHLYPQQQIPVNDLEADDVNTFDADSMVALIASKARRTIPNAPINPQKQTPVANFKAHNAESYSQRQASSPSSHMMPRNSHPMKPQKEASHGRQKAIYFHLLLTAMKDIKKAQDNAGMVDTWEKLMNTKQKRIEQVCRELVEKAYEAQEKAPLPLGENSKSITQYENVADRLSKLESVLTTQKTICKHLLDEPYINRVVTDPERAQTLVEANRRVNFQKKQNALAGEKALGVQGCGKGVPLRAVKKARKQQEESGDECEGTSGNTNNSPENQASIQAPPRSRAKRTHADVGDEDDIGTPIKKSPSKRVKKNAHGRTNSAPALTIDMAAASPMNIAGAPRASAHQHSNSYPGFQSMSGTRSRFAEAPKSGLPHTIASPYNDPEYNQALQDFQLSAGLGGSFYQFNDNMSPSNSFFQSSGGYDMSGNFQSPHSDQ